MGTAAKGSGVAVFTGAELALADAMILLMKVMSLHGVIDHDAINTVFAELQSRYRAQNLTSAAAMAEYLRAHATGADQDTILEPMQSAEQEPQGSA